MNNKNKKIKLFFVIILIIGLVFFYQRQPVASSAPAAQSRPVEVTTLVIKKQEISPVIELPARIASHKISEIRPQAEGVIREINFTEGSFVYQGQQLYQIDPTLYEIAYDNASANLKTLAEKRKSYKNLVKTKAVSRQEYNDAEAAFLQAEAEVKKAETNLIYTKVLAPISGYIGKSNVTVGKLVTANQTEILTTITELDPIYVDMVQPTASLIKLGNQDKVSVSLVIDKNYYDGVGELKFSEVIVDESTDSVRLRAVFPNQDKKLFPGMFLTAKLHLKTINAFLVPQRATGRAPDGSLTVWIIDEKNMAHLKNIKAEQIFEDNWIVTEGLNDGDVVVFEGYQKLMEGAVVNAVPVAPKT